MEFNVMKNEVFEWLNDLKKVFETIIEEELLFNRDKVNYEITLRKEEIKPFSLILIRLEEQHIIKNYLNEMLRKKWIRISKSLIITFLFLVLKSRTEERRLIIDYKKLNKKIVIDLILLLLINNIMN